MTTNKKTSNLKLLSIVLGLGIVAGLLIAGYRLGNFSINLGPVAIDLRPPGSTALTTVAHTPTSEPQMPQNAPQPITFLDDTVTLTIFEKLDPFGYDEKVEIDIDGKLRSMWLDKTLVCNSVSVTLPKSGEHAYNLQVTLFFLDQAGVMRQHAGRISDTVRTNKDAMYLIRFGASTYPNPLPVWLEEISQPVC